MSGSSGSGPQTLQDFLVNIRYNVDSATERKAESTLKNSTYLAIEAGKAFIQLAKDVWDSTSRMAQAFDALYFASQRTGASIESIKALGYAARQAGVSAESVQSTIESVAKLYDTNPAGESFLRQLGVQTRDANGNLIETGRIVEGLGRTLRGMPLPQANVVAGMFGMDYKTLIAMRSGLEGYAEEYRTLQQQIHLDSTAAGADANKLASAMRSFGAVTDVVTDKIKSQFTKDAAQSIYRFRNFVIAHFDDINRAIDWTHDRFQDFALAVERLTDTSIAVVQRVVGWFNGLDEGTKRLIITVGGLEAAWLLLNSAFARSPLGRVLLLSAAILSLLDDFNTWRTGGEHLIPWEKWTAQIDAVNKLFDGFKGDLGGLWKALTELADALSKLGGGGAGSFGHAFNMIGKQALDGFASTLHNVIGDMTHLVQLMTKVAQGDWAGAMTVLQDWKYGSPAERAAKEKTDKDASTSLDERANKMGREDGGDWYYKLFNAPAIGESPTARFFNRARRLFGGQQKGDTVPTPTPGEMGPLMDLIGRTEGTDKLNGYNTMFRDQRGGPMQNLTGMTLDQIDELQGRMIKERGGSPVGRYQFTRETLRDLRNQMGLKGNDIFSPELQDQLLAKRIEQSGGPSVGNLRNIWPSLPGGSQDTHQATQSEFEERIKPNQASAPSAFNAAGSVKTIGDWLDNTVKRGGNAGIPSTPPLASAPSSGVSFTQTTEINVHGAGDPQRTAAEIERGQDRVNRDLVRNGRSAIQ